jgi:hypothetical protein
MAETFILRKISLNADCKRNRLVFEEKPGT